MAAARAVAPAGMVSWGRGVERGWAGAAAAAEGVSVVAAALGALVAPPAGRSLQPRFCSPTVYFGTPRGHRALTPSRGEGPARSSAGSPT